MLAVAPVQHSYKNKHPLAPFMANHCGKNDVTFESLLRWASVADKRWGDGVEAARNTE